MSVERLGESTHDPAVAVPKVLLVCHHYPPHIGGVELVVQKQAESLAEAGYQVVVLTSRLPDTEAQASGRPNITVTRVACSHVLERLFFIPFPLFFPSLLTETWRQVRGADVVHVHDVFYMSSWAAALLASIQGKPILVTQHVALVDHPRPLVLWIQRMVYATAGRWIFARARRIVAYNDNVRAFLLARRVPQARLLPLINGIDTHKFRPAAPGERQRIRRRLDLPERRPLVLFVGRLVEKKGFQILLKARDASFDLVFAGPGVIPEYARTEGVHWLGPLDQSVLAELYRACDLFAFPAIGEVFTLVMQEAMASGLPVLTTDDPAYEGSAASDCVIRCRRDSAALNAAIRAILTDPAQLAMIGPRSRELAVSLFDWQKNFSRLMEVYAKALHP